MTPIAPQIAKNPLSAAAVAHAFSVIAHKLKAKSAATSRIDKTNSPKFIG